MRVLKNSELVKATGALCMPLFSSEEGFAFSVSDNSVFSHEGYNYYAFHITDANNKVVFKDSGDSFQLFFNKKNGLICEVSSYSNGSEYYYFNPWDNRDEA